MADKRLIGYDPLSGMTTYTAEEDGKTVFGYEQDASVSLDYSKALANDGDYTKRGIKQGLLHYAHIPMIVLMKMFSEDRINPFQREYQGEVFRLLNTKYSACKTTGIYHQAREQ